MLQHRARRAPEALGNGDGCDGGDQGLIGLGNQIFAVARSQFVCQGHGLGFFDPLRGPASRYGGASLWAPEFLFWICCVAVPPGARYQTTLSRTVPRGF